MSSKNKKKLWQRQQYRAAFERFSKQHKSTSSSESEYLTSCNCEVGCADCRNSLYISKAKKKLQNTRKQWRAPKDSSDSTSKSNERSTSESSLYYTDNTDYNTGCELCELNRRNKTMRKQHRKKKFSKTSKTPRMLARYTKLLRIELNKEMSPEKSSFDNRDCKDYMDCDNRQCTTMTKKEFSIRHKKTGSAKDLKISTMCTEKSHFTTLENAMKNLSLSSTKFSKNTSDAPVTCTCNCTKCEYGRRERKNKKKLQKTCEMEFPKSSKVSKTTIFMKSYHAQTSDSDVHYDTNNCNYLDSTDSESESFVSKNEKRLQKCKNIKFSNVHSKALKTSAKNATIRKSMKRSASEPDLCTILRSRNYNSDCDNDTHVANDRTQLARTHKKMRVSETSRTFSVPSIRTASENLYNDDSSSSGNNKLHVTKKRRQITGNGQYQKLKRFED